MIQRTSNLLLGLVWFLIWGVIILKDAATAGFWIPWPDPRSPGLLLLSFFFYGVPFVIVAREILDRRETASPFLQRVLRWAAIAFAAGFAILLIILAIYMGGTL